MKVPRGNRFKQKPRRVSLISMKRNLCRGRKWRSFPRRSICFAAAGRGVARCPTEVGRLSSLFDQSIPDRLQIMMFSPPSPPLPSPCNKAGIRNCGERGKQVEEKEERRRLASDYTRGTVSRERVMTRGANYFAMR